MRTVGEMIIQIQVNLGVVKRWSVAFVVLYSEVLYCFRILLMTLKKANTSHASENKMA